MKTPRLIGLKKLANGDYAVCWSNRPKRWNIVQAIDEVIVSYMIFMGTDI